MKSVQIWSFFWFVCSSIRTEYIKMRTRKNSVFIHTSRSVHFSQIVEQYKIQQHVLHLMVQTSFKLPNMKRDWSSFEAPRNSYNNTGNPSKKIHETFITIRIFLIPWNIYAIFYVLHISPDISKYFTSNFFFE